MVIGADIKGSVVFVVEPVDIALRSVDHPLRCLSGLFPGAYLAQHPGAGNHGVGFEELHARAGFHLGRNHAQEVFLHVNLVDGGNQISFHYELQASAVGEVPMPLPMEIDTYGYAVQGERCFVEFQGVIQLPLIRYLAAVPTDLPARGSVPRQAEFHLPA